MTVRALLAAFRKDVRLLLRDPVGLVFLTIAPMIVITVAGFSLASLYGADAARRERLRAARRRRGRRPGRSRRSRPPEATNRAVDAAFVASRLEALQRLERREAGAALVIPAGREPSARGG